MTPLLILLAALVLILAANLIFLTRIVVKRAERREHDAVLAEQVAQRTAAEIEAHLRPGP